MKKIRVQLTNSRWIKHPQHEAYWRGTVFSDGVMRHAPEEIAPCVPQSDKDGEAWGKAVSRLNGFFAFVWQGEMQTVAAVDRVRSIPLFYGKKSETIFISDDAEWIRQQVGDDAVDPIAREEFQLTGYVTGKETLYPTVKQLQPGELLVFNETTATPILETHRYYRFLHTEPSVCDEGALRQCLEDSALAAIQRLTDYAGGRQIVVPLSGGYDSRLIATLLCKLGYKKIFTFSYGTRGNKESAYSRQVAKALGLAWHFVEYSNEQWCSAWNTEERRQYQKWASNWASLPHIQDWVAVRAMKNKGSIDKDCVFVPGHSGDFLAGSHIPDEAFKCNVANTTLLVESILQRHYSLRGTGADQQERFNIWKERVMNRVEARKVSLPADFADAFEKWDWQERQSKFICNSVRAYEFFDYDWWLPLWDAAFMEFWQGVPLELRKGRRWYIEYVQHAYASQTDVDVENSLGNASEIGIFGRSIRSIASVFPTDVKAYLNALHHMTFPKRPTTAYAVSHLPNSETKRLLSAGGCVNGLLAEEFLRMLS